MADIQSQKNSKEGWSSQTEEHVQRPRNDIEFGITEGQKGQQFTLSLIRGGMQGNCEGGCRALQWATAEGSVPGKATD